MGSAVQEQLERKQDGKPIQWTCGGEMVKYFCYNLERWSPGHMWSQVVTIISVDIKDPGGCN